MATHKRLMTVLSKLHFDDERRHDLVYNFTGGRTESTTKLDSKEITDLCWKLENDFRFRSSLDLQREITIKKKRSIVLAIAGRVKIHNINDWSRFNKFMLNRSILKKPLNKYNNIELDKLIKQFRGIEANYKKSAQKAGTKAYFHNAGMDKPSMN